MKQIAIRPVNTDIESFAFDRISSNADGWRAILNIESSAMGAPVWIVCRVYISQQMGSYRVRNFSRFRICSVCWQAESRFLLWANRSLVRQQVQPFRTSWTWNVWLRFIGQGLLHAEIGSARWFYGHVLKASLWTFGTAKRFRCPNCIWSLSKALQRMRFTQVLLGCKAYQTWRERPNTVKGSGTVLQCDMSG